MMGDMADLAREQELDNYLNDMMDKHVRKSDQVYQYMKHTGNIPGITMWRMEDGKYIAISVMTDNHLRNAINMLRRQIDGSIHDEFVYDNIDAMEKELERRKSKMDKITNVDLKVVGVTFKNDDGSSRKDKILEMAGHKDTTVITLEREPSNKFDTNAIKVIADGTQIGYIGKDFAMLLAPMIDNECRQFGAVIKDCGEFKNRPFCELTINEV